MGLNGASGEVRYTSMDTYTSNGKTIIGGSMKNPPFFISPDTLSTGSLGFPIFEYFASSTKTFIWSRYLKIDLAYEMVTVKIYDN